MRTKDCAAVPVPIVTVAEKSTSGQPAKRRISTGNAAFRVVVVVQYENFFVAFVRTNKWVGGRRGAAVACSLAAAVVSGGIVEVCGQAEQGPALTSRGAQRVLVDSHAVERDQLGTDQQRRGGGRNSDEDGDQEGAGGRNAHSAFGNL